MATTIEKTGKSVEDALQAAISELGVNKSDVDVEVLEKPSKGILGFFGNKLARIKVTLKEVPKTEIVEESGVEPPSVINFRVVPSLNTLPTVDDEPDKAENPVVEINSDSEKAVEVVDNSEKENKSDIEIKTEVQATSDVEPNAKVETETKAEIEDIPPAIEDNEEFAEDETKVDREKATEMAKKFLSDVFAAMNIDVAIGVRESDTNIILDLTENKSAILIGKHGQNLDALQYLTNLAANKYSEGMVRFILDVGDYRERREDILKKMAKNAADRVLRTRKEVKLEPMSRHERRVIHSILQDHKRVETHSYGTEPNRYIVVSLKKKGR